MDEMLEPDEVEDLIEMLAAWYGDHDGNEKSVRDAARADARKMVAPYDPDGVALFRVAQRVMARRAARPGVAP
jgi:hypothetical protein